MRQVSNVGNTMVLPSYSGISIEAVVESFATVEEAKYCRHIETFARIPTEIVEIYSIY